MARCMKLKRKTVAIWGQNFIEICEPWVWLRKRFAQSMKPQSLSTCTVVIMSVCVPHKSNNKKKRKKKGIGDQTGWYASRISSTIDSCGWGFFNGTSKLWLRLATQGRLNHSPGQPFCGLLPSSFVCRLRLDSLSLLYTCKLINILFILLAAHIGLW